MSQLVLCLLGPPRLERDGETVAVRRRKVMALLAYLALERRRHSRDALAALLAPGFDQAGARADLRRTLSLLNGVLGAGWLEADRERVGLHPEAHLWLDVQTFRRLIMGGADRVGLDNIPHLKEAVALYQDDFMAGFSVPDSEAFEDWQRLQSQVLRQELSSALEKLVHGLSNQGDDEAAIGYARRWVEFDLTHEPAHRSLMELYARTGQTSAAQQQFRFCEETLAKELGVPPSPETLALYEHIRSGDVFGVRTLGKAPVLAGVRFSDGRLERPMAAALHMALLGKLEIQRDRVPVTGLDSAKSQALLCYLAVTGHPHFRPTLAGLLWGDMPEVNARANLRRELSSLRRIVGEHLIITRQEVAFNQETPYWLDVEAFESTATHLEDVERLREAVELYRDDFLAGFYVKEAPAFEQWVVVQQTRLREMALQALHKLSVYCTDQGEAGLEEGIKYSTRLLALEPSREEAHRQLMLLLAQNGKRGAALAQYEACRQALAEDLGVEPGPKTRELYERIRDGEQPSVETVESAVELPNNLAPQSTPFIGREVELSDLTELIAGPARGNASSPDVRLITIVGPGGMGKTRLAIAVAERALTQVKNQQTRERAAQTVPRFPDGVYFAPLAALNAPEHVLPALADALDFQMQGGAGQTGTPRQQVLDFLRRKRLLLVLDNVEHLLDRPPSFPPAGGDGPVPPPLGQFVPRSAAATGGMKGGERAADLVADILRTAPGVQIVATSRERLNLHEEQVYPIQGLDFPSSEAPEDVTQYTAAQLFLQSARRVQPGFVLKTADVATLTGICQLVGGMPLALELAAAWVDALPLAKIAARISGGLDFLETEWRDVPQRHRSMRAVIDGSWQQLSPDEREVFAQLSVFRGGFTREAARAVVRSGDGAPVSLRTLARLMSKSLVQYDQSRDRYDVHELLRQYAAEKLAEQKSDFFAVRERHSAYYCAALERWRANLHGPRQAAVLDKIEADLENARAAYERAAAEQDVGRLDQALRGLVGFYWRRGRYFEMMAAGQAAVDALNQVDVQATAYADALRLKVVTLTALARVHLGMGQDTQAKVLLQQGAELLNSPALVSHDIRREQAVLFRHMAQAAPNVHAEAQRLFEQSRSLFQSLGDRVNEAWCLVDLGHICRARGDFDGAGQAFNKSLAIHRALSNYVGIGWVLFNLSMLACQVGDFDAAKRMHSEGLVVAQSAGIRSQETWHLVFLGRVHRVCGDADAAREHYAETQALTSMLAFTPAATTALLGLGELAMDVYDCREAKHRFEQGLTLSQEHNSQGNIGHALASLGHLALYQGEFIAAADVLRQSVALTRETAYRLAVAFELAELGAALWSLGDFAAAEKAIEEALAIPEGTGSREELAVLTLYRAQLQTYVGRYEKARELAQATLALLRKIKPESIIGPRIWCPAYIPKSYSGSGAVGRAHGVLGWAALGEERVAEAERALIESVAAFRAIGARDHEAWSLAGLGRAAYGLGNRAGAQQHLIDALGIAVEIGAFIPLLHVMPIVAVVLAGEQAPGSQERAVELYALAAGQAFVANSQLFTDVAGKHIAAATATLPSDVTVAAQKRGKTRDWWDTAQTLLKELAELGWAPEPSADQTPASR